MSVLLLSGGLDSAVCLALQKPDLAVFVNYGQPHFSQEWLAACDLAARFRVELLPVTIAVPWWNFAPEDPTMLTPGRNLVLISIAASHGSPVVIGCNFDDYEIYPDCRPAFFEALRPVVHVETPLIGWTKERIGEQARQFGVAEQTWSCYYPTDDLSCLRCDACAGRRRALQ